MNPLSSERLDPWHGNVFNDEKKNLHRDYEQESIFHKKFTFCKII